MLTILDLKGLYSNSCKPVFTFLFISILIWPEIQECIFLTIRQKQHPSNVNRMKKATYSAFLVFLSFYAIVGCTEENSSIDSPAPVPTVVSPRTGRIWMDRNLGAERVAINKSDTAAFGDLYQWGRDADGHQKRTSDTTSTRSNSDIPGHGMFIVTFAPPLDWRSPSNKNLWQGLNGINNPCPDGFRLPTVSEWDAEFSFVTFDTSGLAALRLPLAGARQPTTGEIYNVGSVGYYWTSTIVNGNAIQSFNLTGLNALGFTGDNASRGLCIRCIKD